MTDIPIVSVIMPVYNAEKYINKAIASILQQSFTDYELIIIDDCGTDNSMKIVEKINDKRIRIIRNATNLGISGSRNLGIDSAKGKYIALMDDDDIAPSYRLDLEVRYLDQHRDIDVVGGAGYWMDENDEIISYSELVICNPKRIRAELMFQDVIENGSAMFRREFVNKNNIRYKDGYLGMEDYKFWTDCSVHGRLANVSDTLLYWRKSECSETSRVQSEMIEERKFKFAEIQSELLINYGFELSDKEINIFTSCFEEDKRGALNKSELNKVYVLIRNLMRQARVMQIDYLEEFNLVLKRRFAQKFEYASFWKEDEDMLFKEGG